MFTLPLSFGPAAVTLADANLRSLLAFVYRHSTHTQPEIVRSSALSVALLISAWRARLDRIENGSPLTFADADWYASQITSAEDILRLAVRTCR